MREIFPYIMRLTIPHSSLMEFSFIKGFSYINDICTLGQKKKTKHPYLFQYKLSYRNETGTNHHGLISTSV